MENIDLSPFGLSENQAKIYLALLELGQANILELANKANLSRITVYNELDDLLAFGYASFVIQGKRKLYLPEPPRKLEKRRLFREKIAHEALPQLEKMYAGVTHRPSVKFYEGRAGLIAMVEDVHATVSDGSRYDVMYNSEVEITLVGRENWNRWLEARKKRGIWVRLICEKTKESKEWDKEGEKTNRLVKFLPKGQKVFVSYHIYENKVSIFSLTEPVVGVIIENKEIADMQRMQFEYMWQGLKG